MAIRGITFDFWDTIVDDDTDEPKRAAKGCYRRRMRGSVRLLKRCSRIIRR